jgi:MYXO-CTERM domain-containing protein
MKRILSTIALAVAALGAAAPAAAAPTFTFTASANQIAIGGTTTIDATISGLDDEILSAFDLNFVYNPAILNWTMASYFGANLGNTIGVAPNALANGNLGFDDSSLDDDAILAATQANSFVLFRFNMVGTADGATNFTLGADADFDRNFVGLNFASLGVDVGSICIAVGTGSCDNNVPEPASYGLAGMALLAAGLAGRRRKQAGQSKA